MGSFNLAERPWIKALDVSGRYRTLSLREVLADADRIAALADSNPLYRAVVQRLLLALVYASVGAPDAQDYPAAAAEGIDLGKAVSFVEEHADGFDLFDPVRPFAQHPALAEFAASARPALALLYETAGAGSVHLDHRHMQYAAAAPLEPGRAALALLARHAFDCGGVQPITAPTLGKGARYGKGGPANVRPWVWAAGATLAASIAASRVPVSSAGGLNLTWKQEDGVKREIGGERGVRGAGDALTWLSRAAMLIATGDGTKVASAVVGGGEVFPAATDPGLVPHTLFDDEGEALGVWHGRELSALAAALAAPTRRGILAYLDHLEPRVRAGLSVEVTGLATYQARVDGHIFFRTDLPREPMSPERAARLLRDVPTAARSGAYVGVGASLRAMGGSADAAAAANDTVKAAYLTRLNDELDRLLPEVFAGRLGDAQWEVRAAQIAAEAADQAAHALADRRAPSAPLRAAMVASARFTTALEKIEKAKVAAAAKAAKKAAKDAAEAAEAAESAAAAESAQ